MNETEVKIAFLRSIIQNSCSEAIVALEVPFQFNERRADVVLLANDKLIAFEIKTKTDKTERLGYQLESYKKIFDYCYVICEQDNLSEIRKVVSKNIGLITVDFKSVNKIRSASEIVRKNKQVLVDFLPRSEIDKLYRRISSRTLKNIYEMTAIIAKNSTTEDLKHLVRLEFKRRYEQKFKVFLTETNNYLTADDISFLTRKFANHLKK